MLHNDPHVCVCVPFLNNKNKILQNFLTVSSQWYDFVQIK